VAALAGRLRGIIKRGEAFSRALEQVGRFDGLLVALVRVGEVSGELARVLAILEEYYQDARKIQRDLLASLTYPAILLMVSVLSVVGLSWYVIPTFKDLFAEDAGRALPLGTRIVFAFSDFVVAYGWMAALALLALGVAAVLLVRGNERVNRAWSRARLGLPLLGELTAKFAAFKLAKALSIMLAGGLPLAKAMEIAQPLLTNRAQREGMDDCLGGLRKGEPVPRAMARIPALPVQFHRYVKLGNETGDLGDSLGRVADILREDFRNRLRAFVAILDPLIIIGMGGMVGFMVISILLAVFNLSDVH
jgi:general secretion pathway protein F